MTRPRIRALLAASTAVAALVAAAPAAPADDRPRGYSFAVIGDVPYGPAAEAAFPGQVDQINADRQVRLVAHLGDIKAGSSVCSDAYFAKIRAEFDRFADPLVYTPGDNEWTDCHRTTNGGYNPLERLAAIRETFFDEPGRTLGRSVRVASQARDGYPENVWFTRADVAFAAVHIVGSNNSMAPWTGNTTPTPAQAAEVLGRTAATVELIKDTFARARAEDQRAVVLLTQADMFDPTNAAPTFADYYAFQPLVATIAREAADFDGPVYLFNGDSHDYHVDRPLAAGSSWLEFYGVAGPVSNLTRVTVDGAADVDNYLKVTIHPRGRQVLSWQRVLFDG